MDAILFVLVEAAIIILPALWIRSIERKEDETELKRQQYKEWTSDWIRIDFTPIVNGEFVR